MKIAVVQHRIRVHERVDLAALLAVTERAAEDGVQVLVYPCVAGAGHDPALMSAFALNIDERAPGLVIVAPCSGIRSGPGIECAETPLGSTIVLAGDRCIDPGLFESVAGLGCDAMVWQQYTESDLQAEAMIELALEGSLSLTPLVLVAATTGEARGMASHGTSAIVHLGELVGEAGEDDDLLVADLPLPAAFTERRSTVPVLAPVLAQRLAVHRGTRAPVSHLTPPE